MLAFSVNVNCLYILRSFAPTSTRPLPKLLGHFWTGINSRTCLRVWDTAYSMIYSQRHSITWLPSDLISETYRPSVLPPVFVRCTLCPSPSPDPSVLSLSLFPPRFLVAPTTSSRWIYRSERFFSSHIVSGSSNAKAILNSLLFITDIITGNNNTNIDTLRPAISKVFM